MGYTVKKNIKIAVKEETTEGTYIAPASGADFVQAQEDGIELTGSKDTLELNVIGTGLSNVAPRVGLESAAGSIGVYMKAGSSATAEPEYGVMVESLLGTKRSSVAITSGTSHTTTLINVSSTADLKIGDIVVVKESGDYHTSPIASLVTNTSITLLIAGDNAFSDSVEIEAFTTYVPADDSHPSYSVSKYVEDEVLEQAVGCKTTSLSVESFSTGQIASIKMGFEGADYSRSLTTIPYSPTYDTSETPIILDACIYQDGVKIEVNDFTLNVENTVGWIKDTCDGKTSSRITNRVVSGTINPYKQDNSIADFTKFDANTSFSLFITSHNPSSTTGEYSENFSFYLPECTITELGEGDIDGVLTEAISFSGNTVDGSIKELYISVS
jgi:hypothetical protein